MTKSLLLGGVIVVAGLLPFEAAAQRYDDGQYRSDLRYDEQYRPGQSSTGVQYDYARVVRVDPIIVGDSGSGQRCYDRADGGYVPEDRGYRDDGYYRADPYREEPYRREAGSETGRQVAMVIGGLAGAVLGSKVGGGDARYIGSAVGGLIGGAAGRSVYEATTRDHYRRSNVRVCEPVGYPQQYGHENERVDGYNVTYEYGGRTYQTRRDYHPGERIRVRVDVSAD